MEDMRFDAAVKFVATGRRAVVAALLGAGVAAFGGSRDEPTAAAAGPQRPHRAPCEDNLDCPGRQVCITLAGGKKNCVSAHCGSRKHFCKSASFDACCPRGTTCCAGKDGAACCESGTTCDPRGVCVT
jgi:hypothetical protein